MLRDLAFYGSAAWVAVFLALVVLGMIEDILQKNRRWRYSVRGLLVAMTFAAVVMGIFSVVFRQ